MSKYEWLTAEDLQRLRACGAPLRYIRALGDLAHPPSSAKHFDYSERYGVFVYTTQRRSLKGAQSEAFRIAETLDVRLGERRSVWDFHGSKVLCFQWTSEKEWNLSVSAEFYTGDYDWCEVALHIHRRFPDVQSREAMDRHVKIALWGPDPKNWPGRHYTGPALNRTDDVECEHPLAALFVDLSVDIEPKTSVTDAAIVAVESGPKPHAVSTTRGTLADLLINE